MTVGMQAKFESGGATATARDVAGQLARRNIATRGICP